MQVNIREVEISNGYGTVSGESPKFLAYNVINFCLHKISTRSHTCLWITWNQTDIAKVSRLSYNLWRSQQKKYKNGYMFVYELYTYSYTLPISTSLILRKVTSYKTDRLINADIHFFWIFDLILMDFQTNFKNNTEWINNWVIYGIFFIIVQCILSNTCSKLYMIKSWYSFSKLFNN